MLLLLLRQRLLLLLRQRLFLLLRLLLRQRQPSLRNNLKIISRVLPRCVQI
jgi:hypothetical protein